MTDRWQESGSRASPDAMGHPSGQNPEMSNLNAVCRIKLGRDWRRGMAGLIGAHMVVMRHRNVRAVVMGTVGALFGVIVAASSSLGASSAAASSSAKAPRIVITSTTFQLAGTSLLAPVTLRCERAACSGSIQMTGTINRDTKASKGTVTKATTVVLASARFRLGKGMKGTFNLRLTRTGRRLLANGSLHSPRQERLVAAVKGGVTTEHSVVISSGGFDGTYTLTVAPGFCGPSGNLAGQVMYVSGPTVTEKDGDLAGSFTGTASPEGTSYHLVLVQPANEIMDEITVMISDGGADITGSGQENLDAGNNAPCPVSFTGHRTSTSVPTPLPSTPGPSAPVTTLPSNTTPTLAPSTTTPTLAPSTTTTLAPTATTSLPPTGEVTIASLEIAAEAQSGLGVGTTARCGPAPTGLGVGSYVACGLFNSNVGGAQEILQMTGTSPSSFNVVVGPGSALSCSAFNAGELAAFAAYGQNCVQTG